MPLPASDDDLPFDARPEAAVLAAEAAPVPPDWVADQLQRHWGVAGELQPLSGERDVNHRLRLADGGQWLVKVSHPVEPPVVTDFQTQALLHLARQAPELPVQRLAPTRAGEPAATARAPDGRPRVLRLISWLEGLPMPLARIDAEGRARQRDSVAALLARLDQALAGLSHPAAALALPWDISRAQQVRSLLQALPDAGQRQCALAALAVFEADARLQLGQLPRQPIHNDFNIHNLLVDPQAPQRLCGVLDFGDMLAAPRINDLAVAAAYQLEPDGDALATVAGFAAAYHRVAPLQPLELDLLWPLVQARLAMVVAISSWRAARQPQQAAYLMRNNAVSWARLHACADITTRHAREALHAACRL